MSAFFDYPKSAAFGRVVPKIKIYEHAGANTALKDMFVREVDQIVWRFKLAPETTNLSATPTVAEIQVFGISLKTGKLDEAILRAIDKAIPFPLIFELTWRGKRKALAAFKRPSEADRDKWVISKYLATDWVPEDAPRATLPLALNMGALYERLLEPLIAGQTARLIPAPVNGFSEAPQTPFTSAEADRPPSLEERIAQTEAIQHQTRVIERIKAQLAREKRFNKRVAINAELRAAVSALVTLQTSSPTEME